MRNHWAYFVLIASAFVIPALCAGAEQRPPLAAGGCWMVLSKGEKPERTNAAEILCLGRDGYGRVRESQFYGEVATCARVSYKTTHGPTYVEVDFSACTNNAPSHRLACASSSGSNPVPCLQSILGDSDTIDMELYRIEEGGS